VTELFHQLGIHPLQLAAQIVNFLILLALLWRFLYKPLLRALGDRRARIEKSLREADTIEKELKSSREKAQQIVSAANEQVATIVTTSEKEAQDKRALRLKQAEAEATQIFKRAEESIHEERKAMQQQVKAEALSLVAQATERLIGKNIDTKKHRQLIADSLKELQ
jgi:F-type H+-transporting ATPase subunit b